MDLTYRELAEYERLKQQPLAGWQRETYANNVKHGFHDYEADIMIVEKYLHLLDGVHYFECTPTEAEAAAMMRIVVDYKKAMLERKLLLVIGEVCEAHEELRSGHPVDEVYYTDTPSGRKPEGVPMELADAIIRVMDIQEHNGLDGAAALAEKHMFNVKRPYKHGKQF